MIMHHGAGYSALSFACLAKELDELIGKDVGVLAFDARRHGKHLLVPRSFELNFQFACAAGKTVPMEGQSDEHLSMDVLVDDLVAIVQTIFKDAETAPVLMVIRLGYCIAASQTCSHVLVLDSSWDIVWVVRLSFEPVQKSKISDTSCLEFLSSMSLKVGRLSVVPFMCLIHRCHGKAPPLMRSHTCTRFWIPVLKVFIVKKRLSNGSEYLENCAPRSASSVHDRVKCTP